MTVLRYANRVPLQFQHAACAITQMMMQTNWRAYGLSQSRGSLARGPGHRDGSHGQRVGAVHQRIEGSDRLVSGNSKGAAAGPASGRPQAGHVSAPPPARQARRGAAEHLPALLGRSGHGRQRHQPGRSRRACTTSCSKWPNAKRPPPTRSSTNAASRSKKKSRGIRRQRADRRSGHATASKLAARGKGGDADRPAGELAESRLADEPPSRSDEPASRTRPIKTGQAGRQPRRAAKGRRNNRPTLINRTTLRWRRNLANWRPAVRPARP